MLLHPANWCIHLDSRYCLPLLLPLSLLSLTWSLVSGSKFWRQRSSPMRFVDKYKLISRDLWELQLFGERGLVDFLSWELPQGAYLFPGESALLLPTDNLLHPDNWHNEHPLPPMFRNKDAESHLPWLLSLFMQNPTVCLHSRSYLGWPS